MMHSKNIQYPLAYAVDEERIIVIREAPRQRGVRYQCLNCKEAMADVVQVTWKVPHFRHIGTSISCEPDRALHTYAIEAIRQGHATATANKGHYWLARHCGCGRGTVGDMVDLVGWSCTKEKTLTPGTRSDLAFAKPETDKELAVEVVVDHAMEPPTEEAYAKAQIRVAVVYPDWDRLSHLVDGLNVVDWRNFGAQRRCDACIAEEAEANREREERARQAAIERQERDHKFETRRQTVDTVLGRMDRVKTSQLQFRPWYKCRNGRPMFEQVQRRVFANAVILTELGFTQHNSKKPWLFRHPIHRKKNVWLYADLGGSDIVPIYKDTAAMVYAFGGPLFDEDDDGAYCCTGTRISNYLVREGGKRLHQIGVDIRFGFEAPPDVAFDNRPMHPKGAEVLVDSRMLTPIIREMSGKDYGPYQEKMKRRSDEDQKWYKGYPDWPKPRF